MADNIYTKISEEFLRDFNLGYTLSQETGLKVNTLDKMSDKALKKLNINKSQLSVIKQGMKQYELDKSLALSQKKENKDIEQGKSY